MVILAKVAGKRCKLIQLTRFHIINESSDRIN